MNQHLTDTEIRELTAGGLPVRQLVAAHDHLSECNDCRWRAEAALPRTAPGAVQRALQLGPVPERDHPEFETLAASLDGSLAPESRAEVQAHLEGCSQCRGEVRAMDAIRRELRDSPTKVYAPARSAHAPSAWTDLFRAPSWRPALAAGAAMVLVVALFVGQQFLGLRVDTPKQGGSLRPFANAHEGPGILGFRVESLNMERNTGPTLLSPISSATTSNTPSFLWSRVTGADHYAVILHVKDKAQVFATGQSITGRQWTVTKPLPSGQTFQWTVQAFHGAQKLGRTSPAATFHVR